MHERRHLSGILIVAGLAAPAAAQTPLATLQSFTVGTSSEPRALQGMAAADLPGLGPTFFSSTGSCVPFVGTGNGLTQFTPDWQITIDTDYPSEPCHFGGITIGADGTLYAVSSEFDGVGFTSDAPWKINTFNATTLASTGSWDLTPMQATYGFEDLSGIDYYHGDLYVVDYRDSSPLDTNIYVFDLTTNPPTMIDLFSISSRKVNGIEIYGNRMHIARDIDAVDGAIDIYPLDSITAGVNNPLETYTFDITDNGSTPLGQHSEDITFNWTSQGPELWVSAAVGTIAREVELPDAPEYVTWTGAGSATNEADSSLNDYFFGWDGQPTADTNAEIELLTNATLTIDSAVTTADLLLTTSTTPGADGHLRIDTGKYVDTAAAVVNGATVVINGGTWLASGPMLFNSASELRGVGSVIGELSIAGQIGAQAASSLQLDALTIETTALVRTELIGSNAGQLNCNLTATIDGGALEVVEVAPPLSRVETCIRESVIHAFNGVTGAFASETLPSPPTGFVSRVVYTTTSVDFVVTRPADFNSDLTIDGADLADLLSQWGPVAAPTDADLDNDGMVTGSDLAILLATWGPCG